jgi:SAM-dependent methyltransferase
VIGPAVARVGDLLDVTLYDRRLGVETRPALELQPDPENHPYLPTRWWVAPRLLGLLQLERDDVLLDAGCGKGRMVFVAARKYELKRVIGIDLQPQLIEVARANAAHLRSLRTPIELLLADATSWNVPDDVTAIYLNHPFRGAVLDAFLDRVLASYDRQPRQLRLLYLHPFNRGQLEARGRFRLMWWRDGPIRKRPARLYEVA